MELINELQLAELEAASAVVEALASKVSSFEANLTSINTALETKVALLDTLHQTDITKTGQTLNGNYFFGDEVVIDSSSKSAHVIFGPSSRLEVRSIPKLTYDVVPKAYVDNIVSPLYSQLSRAIAAKNAIFLTLHKVGSGSSVALTSGNLLSSSLDYTSVFTLGSEQVTFLLGGTYQIVWTLASSDFTALMTGLLKLDGAEIGRMYLSGPDSAIINLVLNINKDSVIAWSSLTTPFTDLSNTLSIVRLGD